MTTSEAIWHDVECGGYEADLPLWSELADRYGSPILDVGAGTGRVALPLAREGHQVTALDVDRSLLDVLRERAGEEMISVDTRCADACSWNPGELFALIIVPMQTIQLFGGTEGRLSFLRQARSSLCDGGAVAIAVADMTPGDVPLPATFPADVVSVGDSIYASRPVCVSRRGATMVIERERVVTIQGAQETRSSYSLEVDDVSAEEIEEEAVTVGLIPTGREAIPPRGAYLGAEVVLLHG